MKDFPAPLDLNKLKVFPLAQRRSLSAGSDIFLAPEAPLPSCSATLVSQIHDCAQRLKAARARGASVILIFGAHLVKNGLGPVVNQLLTQGWITHLATNGAGTIHDWEFAFLGHSEESVRKNVATGTFGTWDETGRYTQLALLAGALRGEGYGRSLGRFIAEDGVTLPTPEELETALRRDPAHPLSAARAELLQAMLGHQIPAGRIAVKHPYQTNSILAQAYRSKIPLTVHPGIGYDIIANHPMFNGAVIGRAAQLDFAQFGAAVEGLDGGVVLNVGSAIMGPQVFEKSLSCVNNLRLQAGRKIVTDHSIYVVDVQDGGNWDWSKGEPPKNHPAYYLRFCKSFARMGGAMNYLECDNVLFVRGLTAALASDRQRDF